MNATAKQKRRDVRVGRSLWLHAFSAVLWLCGCGKPAPNGERPPAAAPEPRAWSRCPHCDGRAGTRHACGLTRWCEVCLRDVASGHVCRRTSRCDSCRLEVGEHHVCGRTRICPRAGCQNQGGAVEGGGGHLCNRTVFCPKCLADTFPAFHRCELRSFACPRCEKEATASHVCGRTRFCPACGHESALRDHVCGKTRWCPPCARELPAHAH